MNVEEPRAEVAVIAKQEIAGHWALVGLSHFYFPRTYNLAVSLPNGRDKWIRVSESDFDSLHENEIISISVKLWEGAGYVRIKQIVENAKSFDDLQAGFRSLNLSDDDASKRDIDGLLTQLTEIQQSALNATSTACAVLPDIPGLREKIAELTIENV